MELKKNMLGTEPQRQKARYWSSLINTELAIFDYLIYNKLQQLARYIKEEAEACGEYHHTTKQGINIIMDECNKLVIACKTSENLEFMDLIVSPYPNYRYEYMREGGYFMQKIVSEWNKANDGHYTKLYYAIKNAFSKHTDHIKHVEMAVRMYEFLLTCQILDAITDTAQKKLKHYTGIDVKQMKMDRFVKIENTIIKLTNKYITCEDMFNEQDHFAIQNGGQAILNVTMKRIGGEIIGDAMVETIEDYSHYCMARWLLSVRAVGDITMDDRAGLRRMGFVDAFIDRIVEELKKTHVGETEKDVMELKDMIYRIKFCKHMNVFVKSMVSVTDTKSKKEAV